MAWKQQFRRDGFAVVGRLVEPDELPGLVALVDALVAAYGSLGPDVGRDLVGSAGGDEGVPGVAQVMAPHRHAPELLDAPFLARATEVGRVALGPEAEVAVAMVVAKPPHSPAEVPWHQDAAYWGHRVRTCGASIWIPLQDVGPDNGCLQFAAGTHVGPVRRHHHLHDDPAIHALELVAEEQAALPPPTAVPLAAGVASIHDGHTVHASGPNHRPEPRRALVCSVRNTARDVPTPQRAAFAWDRAGSGRPAPATA